MSVSPVTVLDQPTLDINNFHLQEYFTRSFALRQQLQILKGRVLDEYNHLTTQYLDEEALVVFFLSIGDTASVKIVNHHYCSTVKDFAVETLVSVNLEISAIYQRVLAQIQVYDDSTHREGMVVVPA